MSAYGNDVALAATILTATRTVMLEHPDLRLLVPQLGNTPSASSEELVGRMHDHLTLAARIIPERDWPGFVFAIQKAALQQAPRETNRAYLTARVEIWAKETQVSYPGDA